MWSQVGRRKHHYYVKQNCSQNEWRPESSFCVSFRRLAFALLPDSKCLWLQPESWEGAEGGAPPLKSCCSIISWKATPFIFPTLENQPSVQFSSVAQSCPTLCDPMNRSTPGLPVHHQFPEFTQSPVRWVGDAILPSYPLSSPSPPTFNLSQHQGLFQWVSSSHQVTKV